MQDGKKVGRKKLQYLFDINEFLYAVKLFELIDS